MEQLEKVRVDLREVAKRFNKRKDQKSLDRLKKLVADKEEQLKPPHPYAGNCAENFDPNIDEINN